MYIRNQEGTVLVDSKMFKVEENGVFMLTDDYTEEGWYLAGEYEDKKRALEVLNSIQGQLRICSSYDIMAGTNRIYKETVFEMPEK